MPKKAAGERTLRIGTMIAAPTFAAVFALAAAGCSSSGGTSPIADPTYSPYAAPTTSDVVPSPTETYYDTSTYSDTSTYADTSTYGDTSTYANSYPTLPNSSPYATNTCFNGPYITSTTAINVDNMNEVDCSSSDAHYQVVKTILSSTDLNDCNNVDNAQYAFSEQDTDGYGVTTWSAVYCLIGLGSYANQSQ